MNGPAKISVFFGHIGKHSVDDAIEDGIVVVLDAHERINTGKNGRLCA